jgi:hypothetical protein
MSADVTFIFDADDVNYLVHRLSLKELRQEQHWGELEAFVQEQFAGTPYQHMFQGIDFPDHAAYFDFPFADYAAACKIALEIKKSERPVAVQSRGICNRAVGRSHLDIETIKTRNDIVEVVSKYIQLIKSGKNFKALCPFHSEKSPSFYVYPEKQNWHCFGACNTGGDVIRFIQKIKNCDFPTAAEILSR